MRGLSPDVAPLDGVSIRAVLANLAGHINGSLDFRTQSAVQPLPAKDDDRITVWVQTINGADVARPLVERGSHSSTMAQANLATLLKTPYALVTLPMFMVAVIAFFTRRTWVSSLGRLAFVVLAGWLTNLLVVSLFYAGTNRTFDNAIPLYTMGSQSYLIVGLTLIAVVAARPCVERLGRLVTGAVPVLDAPEAHPAGTASVRDAA